MKNKLYDLYLKSPEWKAISDECKRLANFKCNRCDNTTNLHAHHLTYDNIGEEKQEDLECLCLSCHEIEHGKSFSTVVKKPPFILIGNGRYKTNEGYKSMDAIDVISKLTKVEVAIVQYMKNILIDQHQWNINNPTSQDKYRASVVQVPTIEALAMNSYLKKGMAKSYKNLVDMNILIRIRRNVYMINPNFIIPPENYKEANDEWEKIMNIKKPKPGAGQ